jgi:uncharacterized protein (DUF1330 family)
MGEFPCSTCVFGRIRPSPKCLRLQPRQGKFRQTRSWLSGLPLATKSLCGPCSLGIGRRAIAGSFGSSGTRRYLIAEHIITDPVKFEEYRAKVGPMMAKYGARYLTKGAGHKMPEGGHWKPERVVVIEFPEMASIDAWYNSAEYQPLIALRKAATSDQDMLFVLEGA